MQKHIFTFLALLMAVHLWAKDINSSTPLSMYYAEAEGKSDNTLRTALQDAIKNHIDIGYKNLGIIMQWSDTEDANGSDIIDIYTTCTFTTLGPLKWASSGNVGDGLNREHTVPQSWFDKKAPMVSDAFHIYPTDCKANNHRSSYLYGECENGTSLSTKKCAETGKLGASDWSEYTGTVYEVEDEYKGDIARSYFYMATRYAGQCEHWTGGAFGSDNNGLDDYTAQLMLKWHRQDPVSEKELIRNEVIFGNPLYNKCDKKQANRNPFIDYPELVEYVWGEKKDVPVALLALDSPYANEGKAEGIEIVGSSTTATKLLKDGQLFIIVGEQMYNLQGKRVK